MSTPFWEINSRVQTVELEDALKRPNCSICKSGRIRPTSRNGDLLIFRCATPQCRWRGQAPLPKIEKCIIYLDTSIVSNIATSLHKKQDESCPWIRLFNALRKGAASEAICCPGSSVVKDEAELARLLREIDHISNSLGDPRFRHSLSIFRAQMFRALDRFISGKPPMLETDLPETDAFSESPHSWGPDFGVHVLTTTSPKTIEARRAGKPKTQAMLTGVFQRYATQGYDFERIRSEEAKGVGKGILEEAALCFAHRLKQTPVDETTAGYYLTNEVELVYWTLLHDYQIPTEIAASKTFEFFQSEHLKLIAVADIESKLYASLALRSAGPTARPVGTGDKFDVEHVAYHMPYCDVFIVDRFFADVCNESRLRLGDLYKTDIRCVGPNEVDGFIDLVEGRIKAASQSGLSDRIQSAIMDGGYPEEMTIRLKNYMKAQGIDPENPGDEME